jgi:hypothetical protein
VHGIRLVQSDRNSGGSQSVGAEARRLGEEAADPTPALLFQREYDMKSLCWAWRRLQIVAILMRGRKNAGFAAHLILRE